MASSTLSTWQFERVWRKRNGRDSGDHRRPVRRPRRRLLCRRQWRRRRRRRRRRGPRARAVWRPRRIPQPIRDGRASQRGTLLRRWARRPRGGRRRAGHRDSLVLRARRPLPRALCAATSRAPFLAPALALVRALFLASARALFLAPALARILAPALFVAPALTLILALFLALAPPLASSLRFPTLQIPSLNHTPLERIKPNTVVRYRCMVQDMLEPEFYLAVYDGAAPGQVRAPRPTPLCAVRRVAPTDECACCDPLIPASGVRHVSRHCAWRGTRARAQRAPPKPVACSYRWRGAAAWRGGQGALDFGSTTALRAERHVLYCVPVPGETTWVHEISAHLQQDTGEGG